MDWASDEWKQALTPFALQKVRVLEDKIEILQKDRTQKQLQYECLEITLEKEKRKAEKEKQNVSEVQRELQSLAEICKDFESKQQKLQQELQTRDSRIKNLEALLAQSRKEISKLQQQESDFKDLSFVRELKQQKLISNKSKNDDSSFQGELISNSLIDNSEFERPLKQKIEEQEELIKKLRAEISSVSKNEALDSSNVFKTPHKANSMSVTDSPSANGKSSWNVFSSTPAKGNKDKVLGHGDTTSVDSGNEKIASLQSRLKQLHQELDCQRHNFEASKNALEQKYKDSESTLKADLKFHMQANMEMDKELKDSKNKHQQEINQTVKKLDVLTLQFKKSEEAKVAYEKDLKSIESRLSLNESKLTSKEAELQELLKCKNESEASQQLLQSKIRDLEKNCRSLNEEKVSLKESINAIQMQLEGSNNLVKDKDTSLHSAQQELANLQLKLSELQNCFTVQGVKLNDSQASEMLAKGQLESILQEKKELNDKLNSEIKRNESFEFNIEQLKSCISGLEKELSAKDLHAKELLNQIISLENKYQELQEVETELTTSKTKIASLENERNILSLNENSLKEKVNQLEQDKLEMSNQLLLFIEQEKQTTLLLTEKLENQSLEFEAVKVLKDEHEKYIQKLEQDMSESSKNKSSLTEKLIQLEELNKKLSDSIVEEISKNDNLKLNLDEEIQKFIILKEELVMKSSEIKELQSAKAQLENDIQGLNVILTCSNEKIQSLECEFGALTVSESELKKKIELLEQNKLDMANQVMSDSSKIEQMQLDMEKEKGNSCILINELEDKCKELEKLLDVLKEDKKKEIQEKSDQVASLKDKMQSLEYELSTLSTNENNLKEKIKLIEKEKSNIDNQILEDSSKILKLESLLEEERQHSSLLTERLKSKCVDFEELKKVLKEHETSKYKLEQELREVSLKEASLIEKLQHVEELNKGLFDDITSENLKNGNLSSKLDEETQRIVSLKNEIEVLNNQLEEKDQQLEIERSTSLKIQAELAEHLKKLQDSNEELLSKLCSSESEKLILENETCKLLSLKEELSLKLSELEQVQSEMMFSKNQLENEIQELKDLLQSSQSKITDLESKLNAVSSNDIKDKLMLMEQEKLELAKQLKLKMSEVKQLKLCAEKKNELNLEEKLAAAEHELDALKKQLNDLSLTKTSLNEKINQLELSKKQLFCDLNEKSNKVNYLKESYEEKVFSLKELLASKSLQLEELEKRVLSMSNEFETKVKSLENEILVVTSSKNNLQSKIMLLEENQLKTDEKMKKEKSNCILLEEKLKVASKEFEDLAIQMKALKENEAKSNGADKKLHAAIEQLGKLQNDLHESSLLEISLKEEIQQLENANKELLLALNTENERIVGLQSILQEKSQRLLSLETEFSSKSSELKESNRKISDLKNQSEESIRDLKNQLDTVISNTSFLEIKLNILEQDKLELSDKLKLETNQSHDLKTGLENERKNNCSLKEKLSSYCAQIQEHSKQIKNVRPIYEAKISKLQEKLATAETKSLHLEQDKQTLNQQFSEQIGKTKKESDDMMNRLTSANTQIQQLKLNLEEEIQASVLLKEEITKYQTLVKQLNDQIKNEEENYEKKVVELKTCCSTLEEKNLLLESAFNEFSQKEPSLKENAALIENDKNELLNQLGSAATKIKELEEHIKIEKQSYSLLKEELKIKYVTVEELHIQLEAVTEKYKVESSVESVLNEKLNLVMQENSNLSLQLKSEVEKVQQLQSNIKVEKETLALLKEELDGKNIEIEKLGRYMEDNSEIQMLEAELSSSEVRIASLENKLDAASVQKNTLKEKLLSITQEKEKLSQHLEEEIGKVQQLESGIESERQACISLKEKLESKCQELENLNNEVEVMKNYQKEQIQKLEQELSLVQSAYTALKHEKEESSSNEDELKQKWDDLVKEKENLSAELEEAASKYLQCETAMQNQQKSMEDYENRLLIAKDRIQACTENEESMKENLAVLEKENIELSEKLGTEHQKIDRLQILVQQLTFQNKALKEELVGQSAMLNNASGLTNDYQNQIQDLEKKLYDNQKDHQDHLHECTTNENNLKQNLLVLDKDCKQLSEKLAAEILKAENLELLVKDLQNTCAALEEQLNEVNQQKVTLQNLHAESPNKLVLGSTPRRVLFSSHSSPVTPLDMTNKGNEVELVKSEKEVEYSQDLHTLSLSSLQELNLLEDGLVANIEMWKFLYIHKVIKESKLASFWEEVAHAMKQLQMIQFLKKYMFNVCNILKSNVVYCKLNDGNMKLPALLAGNQSLFSQSFFDICGDNLNKLLFSVSQTLQLTRVDIEGSLIRKYNTVHTNFLPVFASVKFLMQLQQLTKSYIDSELEFHKQIPLVKVRVQNVQKALTALKEPDLPYFVVYAMAFKEYMETVFGKANSILHTDSQDNSFSLSSLFDNINHYLNWIKPVHEELNCWKTHCTMLGLSESDIEKLVLLLELNRTASISEITNGHLKEISLLREECGAAQKALLVEKEKQLMLNATIEEIEQDLGETFQQKEKYMMMILEISKVLAKLKNIAAGDTSRLEGLSDSCYCEVCILQDKDDVNDSHEKIPLQSIFQFRADVEAKLQCSQEQFDFVNARCKDLEDRNSELQASFTNSSVELQEMQNKIEGLNCELIKEKDNYQQMSELIDRKENQILELETSNLNLSIENEQYQIKLENSEESIAKLSTDIEELTTGLLSKQAEVATLENTLEEYVLKLQDAQLQSKEYDNKIQFLNSTIAKFEEEQEVDKHLRSSYNCESQTTISQLEYNVELLKKANDSLNLNIECIEEELGKLTSQNKQLEADVSSATQNFISEQQENKRLSEEIKRLEETKSVYENDINDLVRKNTNLEKDVSLLKGVLRDHEQLILSHNSSLTLKDQLIDCLKAEVAKIEQDNIKLNLQLKDSKLKNQQQSQLNTLTDQCSLFEKEVQRLKNVEVDNVKLMEKAKEIEIERDMLLKNVNVLQTQLDTACEHSVHNETKCKEIMLKFEETNNALNKEMSLKCSLQEELNEKETCIQALNKSLEELKLRTIKQKEENVILVQNAEDFKKKYENVRNSLKDSHHKQEMLLNENKDLALKLEQPKSLDFEMPELQNLKSRLTSAIHFILNILKIAIPLVKLYPDAKDLSSNLADAYDYWTQCLSSEVKTEMTFFDVFNSLRHFFGIITNEHKIEQTIQDHVKSIIYSLNIIGDFCESRENGPKCADMTNMSMFETTIVNFGAVGAKSGNCVVTELQKAKKLIEDYFSNIKETIDNQAYEIKMMKTNLNESPDEQASLNTETNNKSVTMKRKKNVFPDEQVSLSTETNNESVTMKRKMNIFPDEQVSLCTETNNESITMKRKLSAIPAEQTSLITEDEPNNKSESADKQSIYLLMANHKKLGKNFKALSKQHNLLLKDYEALSKDHEVLSKDLETVTKDRKALSEDNEKLKEHFEVLEQEKQNLEEEAEELAADFKRVEDQLYNNDELAVTLTQLVQTQQKLKESVGECDFLKNKLEYCRANHGKKSILGMSESASNVLATDKENIKYNVR